MTRWLLSVCVASLALISSSWAADGRRSERMEWTIDGVKREADVFPVASQSNELAPLVFAFHGHGGNMRNAARSFRIHELWPEAIVVYMQGLNTPGKLTDPEGKKPGWQPAQGDQGDRDLKFFDAVLATLKEKFKVDSKRIYSTGHSNGGGFTYLLWSERFDVFAAVAPSAAAGHLGMKPLKPKPVMHIAGENDQLVKFQWQQLMMTRLKALNGCDEATDWEKVCKLYPSKTGTPVVTFIHSGGHQYPSEAPELIVKFFKQHHQ